MNETAKKAGCAILGMTAFAHGLPETNNAEAPRPNLVRKEEAVRDEHSHDEKEVPKPAEVRDIAAPAIISGQRYVYDDDGAHGSETMKVAWNPGPYIHQDEVLPFPQPKENIAMETVTCTFCQQSWQLNSDRPLIAIRNLDGQPLRQVYSEICPNCHAQNQVTLTNSALLSEFLNS